MRHANRGQNGGLTNGDAYQNRHIQIHRCRFMNWEPRGVVQMVSSTSGELLAVARDNGNVEIRHVREKFRVSQTVQATKEGFLRAMAWSRHAADSSARLFVGSLDASICEVDVRGIAIINRRDSYGGAVWCLAAAKGKDVVAVGCEDGSIKLFSTANGGLEFTRSLPSINARILSIAWQPNDAGLFVGAVDGTIRHVDPITGHSAYRMTLESRNSLSPPTMVWCLKVLNDGTVISGDSLGSIHFWDGTMGTLSQSFTVHEADILAIGASEAGDVLFASGIDSKLVCFKRDLAASSNRNSNEAAAAAGVAGGKWVITASNRAHSHDLTALAVVNKVDERGRKVLLVSGGKDTKLCTYSLYGFASNRPRYIAPYPYHALSSLASRHPSRLFLMQHDRKIHIWRLRPRNPSALLQDPVPALEIQAPQGKGNIVCATLSPDGRYLAYATAEDTRIFELKEDDNDDEGGEERSPSSSSRLVVSRLKHGLSGRAGVTAMTFSMNSKHLVVGTRKGVVARMELKTGLVVTSRAANDAADGDEDGVAVTILSCNPSGSAVAVGRLKNRIEVRHMKDLGLDWIIPGLDSAPTTMTYHSEANVLVVACVSNRFYLFDGETKGLTDWSKDLGHRLPAELLDRHDCIVGICFNPGAPNTLLVNGFGFVCYVDLDRPMGKMTCILPETHPAAAAQAERLKKRKRVEMEREKRRQAKAHSKARQQLQDVLPVREEAKDSYGLSRGNAGGGEMMMMNGHADEGKEPTNGVVRSRARSRPPSSWRQEEADDVENWNMKLHFGYQGILSIQALDHDEIFLIEEPWLKIVSRLPDVLERKRYGV